MNDDQVLEQLAETDAYAPGTLMPALAWSRETALSEVERRMGMEPRESTKQSTITSAPTSEDQPDVTSPLARTRQPTSWWRGPRVAVGVAAATAVALLAVFAIVNVTGSDESDAAAARAQTIHAYVEAYNAGDIDGIMALFTEQSVITGHPWRPRGAYTGLEEIKMLQEQDVRSAAAVDAYTFSNVEVSGNTVTWDHVRINRSGEDWCGGGHVAIVEDGKILSWDFAAGQRPIRCNRLS